MKKRWSSLPVTWSRNRSPWTMFSCGSLSSASSRCPRSFKSACCFMVCSAPSSCVPRIYVGALLLAQFHWILYIFGLFLLLTGVRMLASSNHAPDLDKNPILRWMRGHMKITREFHGEKFFVARAGIRYATPLFLTLVLVEVTDLIFSVDSIPAIFAITNDPFIVFTSNIFAILGLRAMYFLLADMAERFHLLKYGLAAILVFIGVKMLLLDVYKIPIWIALGIVALILLVSVAASLVTSRRTASR